MKIKTYQALTMQEAIKQIKAELGPEAVILSTKQVRATSGTLALLNRMVVEVTAATDLTPQQAGGTGRRAGAPEPVEPIQPGPRFDAALRDSLDAVTIQSSSRTRRQAEGRIAPSDRQPAGAAPPPPAAPVEPGGPSRVDQEWGQMRAELKGLRELLERALGERPKPEPRKEADAWLDELPGRLGPRYRDLIARGLAPAEAQRLVTAVRERGAHVNLTDDGALGLEVRRLLAREVKVSGPLLGLGEWKKTAIFVGPTGVGKTTTIAKIAAHYRLRENRSVALITLDTYRVAAVEQLRSYAKLLDVTLDVALTKRDALDFIRQRSKAELILIDTTGRSPRDGAGMEELRQLVTLDHPLETHLVLSATTREQDLADHLARYAGIPIQRLLFTKLDETMGYGGLYDMMRQTGLPLSYLGTGQNVPEDLAVARPELVADLLLGGTVPAAEKKREGGGVKGEAHRQEAAPHASRV